MNPSSLLLKRLYLLLHFSWLLLLYNLCTSGKSVWMVLLAALYSNMPSNGQTLGYNEFYQVSALQHISGALRVRRSSLFIWHSPVLTCPLSPILPHLSCAQFFPSHALATPGLTYKLPTTDGDIVSIAELFVEF